MSDRQPNSAIWIGIIDGLVSSRHVFSTASIASTHHSPMSTIADSWSMVGSQIGSVLDQAYAETGRITYYSRPSPTQTKYWLSR